jgi:hypothetical protein
MKSPKDINHLECPIIQKIIDDECWLKGERVHHVVSPTDPEICLKVAEIVLQIGETMRQSFETLSCIE